MATHIAPEILHDLLSRREVMIGAAGLTFAVALTRSAIANAAIPAATIEGKSLSPWVSIATDGTISITVSDCYAPPMAIRAPDFGVTESHMMYHPSGTPRRLFIYEDDLLAGPVPYRTTSDGQPYTHYVDGSDVNSSPSAHTR